MGCALIHSLRWNVLCDEGAGYLSDALKVNTSLKELNLKYNDLNDQAKSQIKAAAGAHVTLYV